MKKHNTGTVIAVIFCVAVLMYIAASGGVHAEKADDARWEETYAMVHRNRSDTDVTRVTGDIRKDEVTNEETTTAWLDSVIARLDAVVEETEAEVSEDSNYEVEWHEEEIQYTDDADIDYSDSDDSGDNSGDAVWYDEADSDVYQLAWDMYGIDNLTVTRMLKLITLEGYEEDYLLDYYVACACVTRARFPENFDGSNIYEKFGEADPSYGIWIDSLSIADHAVSILRDALTDYTYINQCNGCASPSVYIYYSERYGIYVWNP